MNQQNFSSKNKLKSMVKEIWSYFSFLTALVANTARTIPKKAKKENESKS